jgi:hypothetical protein
MTVAVSGVPCLPGLVVSVAARIDALASPAMVAAGALYTLTGTGFAPGATTLSLGGVVLTPTTTTAPAPGMFVVAANGLSVTFALPDPLPSPKTYPISVSVNGVVSLPGFSVTL